MLEVLKVDNINSNSGNNPEEKNEEYELFSYDFSNNAKSEEESFDLNSFSSNAPRQENGEKKSKATKKQKIIKTVLTLFLVGLITVSLIIGSFLFYAFTMVDATMDEDLENNLNFTTTIYVDDGKGGYK